MVVSVGKYLVCPAGLVFDAMVVVAKRCEVTKAFNSRTLRPGWRGFGTPYGSSPRIERSFVSRSRSALPTGKTFSNTHRRSVSCRQRRNPHVPDQRLCGVTIWYDRCDRSISTQPARFWCRCVSSDASPLVCRSVCSRQPEGRRRRGQAGEAAESVSPSSALSVPAITRTSAPDGAWKTRRPNSGIIARMWSKMSA